MKTCRQCNAEFDFNKEDAELLKALTPIIAGKKFALPEPTLCPFCRTQNHLSFRNERCLYKRKSDLSGKEMLSVFAPDSPFKAIAQDEWWSDKWNPLDYGRNFDFSKTFTEQFHELNLAIPHMALCGQNNQNCDYTNFVLNSKNCYLMYATFDSEDCLYDRFGFYCKDTLDCFSIDHCELCYEGIDSSNCYRCMFFQNCRNCSDSIFLEESDNCSNCFMCYGLRNKEYYYLNEFIGKEKFEQLMKEIKPLTNKKIEELQKKFTEFKKTFPHPNAHIYASENCSGDIIKNCKDCYHSFDVENCENTRYGYVMKGSHNSMDITYAAHGANFSYQLCGATGCEKSMACWLCWDCSNSFYSMECNSCMDIFGCIGLHRKKYCIFNKQYSKEEYEKLVPQIIEHMRKTNEWGAYLDKSLSHFAYNETSTPLYFPLTKEEALKKGYRWHEEEKSSEQNITEQVLISESSGKPYKITSMELKFYRTMGLPIPLLTPNERYELRFSKKNPYRLSSRKCDKCGKNIQTNSSAEKIFCQECYLKEVY